MNMLGRVRTLIGSLALLAAATAAHAQDTISLGAVLPLSGGGTTQGEDQRRGIELAVERVNAEGGILGKKLRVIIEDSGGRPQTTLDAAKKLVTVDNVPLVIGEYSSGNTLPLGQYLLQAGRVHVNIGSSSGRIRQLGDGSFSLIGLDNVSSGFAAEDVIEMGYKRAAFLFPNNAYGQGVNEQLGKAYQALGGEIVGVTLYTEGQTSFRRELLQLSRGKPDIYIYSTYGKDASAINREAFELGLTKAAPWYGIYLLMSVSDSPEQMVEGHIGMDLVTIDPSGKFFEDAYRAKYKENFKSTFSGFAYDAVMMSARAIARAGKTDPASIREALKQVGQSYAGATGPITFDADRMRLKQPYLRAVYKQGKLVAR